MSAILRKGWCPTLTRPMQTGDGLLVRFHIKYGILTAENTRHIADFAARYGNGHIDLTSRGNLQIRGVKQEEYEALFAEISARGFSELPRPERPANPDYTTPLGFLPTHNDKGTVGLGLAFGRLNVSQLHWLADCTQRYGNGTIALSPWRAIYFTHVNRNAADTLIGESKLQGFITDNHDARRMIQTCPGAPACSSAFGATRELALAVAEKMPDLVASKKTIHISGCAKGCACPQKTSVMITATQNGYDLAWDDVAGASAFFSLNADQVLEKIV